MSKNVWVQLVWANCENAVVGRVTASEIVNVDTDAFKIKDFEGNVGDLKKKIKEEMKGMGIDNKVELTIYQIKKDTEETDDLVQFQLDMIAGSRLSPKKAISEISESETIELIAAYRRALSGLPHRTPRANQSQRRTAPPSTGKEAKLQTQPRKAPSSEEGKIEGLDHASCDGNTHMQCTSTPAAAEILKILEQAIDAETQTETADNKKFKIAAKHVITARNRLANRTLPTEIGTNERFFTGSMASALNSVLDDGYFVLHQACLGAGTTHSDLSAACITTEVSWPSTLMVGEGKWNSADLRRETRGQIFNELLRHRTIDQENLYGPIILFAFDKSVVEIDLAFPSTKGGKMETDGVVDFSNNLIAKEEAFWTVTILRTSIESKYNLSIVLRFLSSALKKIHEFATLSRVQQKQFDSHGLANLQVSQYCGENVTIVGMESGPQYVCKEYCYHLRQRDDFMMPFLEIDEEDKRQPPPLELLEQLGPPYSHEWKVNEGVFGTSVLCYPFIEGSSFSPSVSGWLQILCQVKRMHELGFVHGDLLPRNVLFNRQEGSGYVIDFDLTRKEGCAYVRGYNHNDFQQFRHKEAKQGQKMAKDHDLHALRRMSVFYFDLGERDIGTLNLEELINFFKDNEPACNNLLSEESDEATGSPRRSWSI